MSTESLLPSREVDASSPPPNTPASKVSPGEPGPITTFQGIGYVLNVDETPPLEAANVAGSNRAAVAPEPIGSTAGQPVE